MIQPLINITRKQALLFASFLVFYEFLIYISNDMIMPGMLDVIHTFHASPTVIATSLTTYVLGGASLQLVLGPISDRFGRRPVMLFGAGVFALLTLMIPFTQSMTQFLVARFFEGMGLCYISVVGYALLQEIFSEQDAIRVITIMANVAILGPLLGPLAGAEFLQYGTWHGIFYAIGTLSVLASWGLYRYMPESVGQIKRDGKMIQRSTLTFAAIFKNYRTLAKHPVFVWGTLAYALMGVICVVWIALSPVLLVSLAKLSLIEYGLWQIPVFGAFMVGNVLLSYLSKHYSVMKLSLIGSIIVVVGALLMCLIPLLSTNKIMWLMPGLVTYCLGYGMAVTALNRFILFVTQVGTGTTSALISMVTMCCLAGGNEIANYCFAESNVQALIYFFGGIGVLYFICVMLSLMQHKDVKVLGVENV